MIATFKAKLQSKIANDKHFAELVKGSGIAFVLRVVGIIAGYIFTLLVTRTLGAEAWGIFALSLVVLQIASVIGRLGIDTALLRFTAEYVAKGEICTLKDIYKKTLTLVVPFSILVAISVYFLSPILANEVFHKPYLTNYFRIVSFIIVPFVLLWIHSESIRGLKKIKEYMLLQQTGISIIAVILFLMGLVFVKSHFLPIVSYSIAVLILTIISIFLWHKYLANFLTVPPTFASSLSFSSSTTSNNSYKYLLSVSVPMLLSSSLALIMGWTDTIMLGMFRSAREVGVYNVALRVSMMTSITLMAINTIAAPKFAEFWGRGDIKGLAEFVQQSAKLIFWSSFLILLIFCFFPSHILNVFGSEFKVGTTALRVLIFGQFINAVSGSVGYILQMTGRQKVFQNIILIATIMNITLNAILIPRFGINGAAFASMISMIFWNISSCGYIRLVYKFNSAYIPFKK